MDGLEFREVDYAELQEIVRERNGQYMDPNPPRTWFGAFLHGVLVGCCAVQCLQRYPMIGVYRNDYVRVAYRRQGIYREMFRWRNDWCREHEIDVIVTRFAPPALPAAVAAGFEVLPDWPETTPAALDLRSAHA